MSTEQTQENGNHPDVRIVTPPLKRVRASWPILVLALLFVVASFLTWYFTWFGRDLSDSEISQFLTDEKHPRHVQHALLQIQQRIERGDNGAKQWYPQIVMLAGSPETVLGQIRTISEKLGAGILDLIFQPVGRDKTLRAIELFGTRVLPRMREL